MELLTEHFKGSVKSVLTANFICVMCNKVPLHVFFQLLLCSLYEIYQALEEELDRNADRPSVQPIYFPQELARLESLEMDLEHFFGPHWRKRITVPAATHRYTQRLREASVSIIS